MLPRASGGSRSPARCHAAFLRQRRPWQDSNLRPAVQRSAVLPPTVSHADLLRQAPLAGFEPALPPSSGARCSRRLSHADFLRQAPLAGFEPAHPAVQRSAVLPPTGESTRTFLGQAPLAGFEPALPPSSGVRCSADGESRGPVSVKRPWQDSNLRSRRPAECGAPADGESRGRFSVKRPWQDSNLRSRLRRAVLYPLSYRGSWGAKEGYPSRPAGHESVRRYRRETGPPTPIPLVGDPRTARVDHRRRPPGARRRRRRQPARRRPHHGGGRASAQQGARGLRDQRRAPAGEEGGHQPAGLRRAGRRAAAEPPTGSRPSTSPARGSSTSRSRPAPRARSRQTCSRPGRRTAATTRSPASGSTSSSSRPTRPARCTSATPGGPRSATRWPGCSTRPVPSVEREFYINDRGVADGQVRRLGRGPGARASRCRRTATRARTSTTSRSRCSPRSRASSTCPTTSGRSRSGRPATGSSSRSSRASLDDLPHPLRRLVLASGRCTLTPPWPTAWRSCAARATCSTPTVRSGCAPPTSATTRTGC